MNFGLNTGDEEFIVSAIRNYADVDEALVFGSRAMGNYKPTSDIDIALKGALSVGTVSGLSDFLNNASPFANTVDVIAYDAISNAELKKHIDRYGKRLYVRT